MQSFNLWSYIYFFFYEHMRMCADSFLLGIPVSILSVVILKHWNVLRTEKRIRRCGEVTSVLIAVCIIVSVIGCMMNFRAVDNNGGQMPVINVDSGTYEDNDRHQYNPDINYNDEQLCDQYYLEKGLFFANNLMYSKGDIAECIATFCISSVLGSLLYSVKLMIKITKPK